MSNSPASPVCLTRLRRGKLPVPVHENETEFMGHLMSVEVLENIHGNLTDKHTKTQGNDVCWSNTEAWDNIPPFAT